MEEEDRARVNQTYQKCFTGKVEETSDKRDERIWALSSTLSDPLELN